MIKSGMVVPLVSSRRPRLRWWWWWWWWWWL